MSFYWKFGTVSFDANGYGEGILQCDAGDPATGGGFSMNNREIVIMASTPWPYTLNTSTAWYVRAYNAAGVGSTTVYVICADMTTVS